MWTVRCWTIFVWAGVAQVTWCPLLAVQRSLPQLAAHVHHPLLKQAAAARRVPVQAAAQYSATGLPSLDAASLSQPQEAAAGADGATLYRCRKCRALVATQHNVVETEQVRGGEVQAGRTCRMADKLLGADSARC